MKEVPSNLRPPIGHSREEEWKADSAFAIARMASISGTRGPVREGSPEEGRGASAKGSAAKGAPDRSGRPAPVARAVEARESMAACAWVRCGSPAFLRRRVDSTVRLPAAARIRRSGAASAPRPPAPEGRRGAAAKSSAGRHGSPHADGLRGRRFELGSTPRQLGGRALRGGPHPSLRRSPDRDAPRPGEDPRGAQGPGGLRGDPPQRPLRERGLAAAERVDARSGATALRGLSPSPGAHPPLRTRHPAARGLQRGPTSPATLARVNLLSDQG